MSPQMLATPDLALVPGLRAAGVHCGLKKDRLDLAILWSPDPRTTAAAVFTQNAFAAAPVHVSRQHVAGGQVRAIVVNSGNANACTGRSGLRDALEMARATAGHLGLAPDEVLVCSTGRIGIPMQMDKLRAGIDACAARIQAGEGDGHEAAAAILTTDSGPKEASRTFMVEGHACTLSGIAKGAGMIHPNMATMLAFLATDVQVAPAHLQAALAHAVDRSFNQISVDGDESTNDTCAILATAAAPVTLHPDHPAWPVFQATLTGLCQELARRIAADGEGATRLLRVVVEGGATDADARGAARAVCASNLVKCAMHGSDPNWGRIVSAMGQSDAAIDPLAVDIWIGNPQQAVQVLAAGEPQDSLAEARACLDGAEVLVRVHLHQGAGAGEAWGCDMTEEYVTFNAQYTT